MKKIPTIRISHTQFLRLPLFNKEIVLDKRSVGTFYRISNDDDYLISLGDTKDIYEIISELTNLGSVIKPKTVPVKIY